LPPLAGDKPLAGLPRPVRSGAVMIQRRGLVQVAGREADPPIVRASPAFRAAFGAWGRGPAATLEARIATQKAMRDGVPFQIIERAIRATRQTKENTERMVSRPLPLNVGTILDRQG
jgi:hypothetical protein